MDSPSPRVYAHWHGDELVLVGIFAFSQLAVMVSHSADGGLMARVLGWLGYRVVRGSSTRNGAAGLKGLIGLVRKDGLCAALAVDGPRGPVFEVKGGILKLAQQTGCLVIPGAVAASARFVFKRAWNRCFMPLPFAKCAVVYGTPFLVSPGATDQELENERLRLQCEMVHLKVEAESYFKREPTDLLFKASLKATVSVGA